MGQAESAVARGGERDRLTVHIWSDIVCPWCYVGEHRFESALARFPHRDAVNVRHRSFELERNAPALSHTKAVEHLADKYGVSRQEAEQLEQRAANAAAAKGLPFRLDRIRTNTFDSSGIEGGMWSLPPPRWETPHSSRATEPPPPIGEWPGGISAPGSHRTV